MPPQEPSAPLATPAKPQKPARSARARWLRRAKILGALTLVTLGLRGLFLCSTAIAPPPVTIVRPTVRLEATRALAGEGELTRRGSIWQVKLQGAPVDRGLQMSALLRQKMVEDEQVLYGAFEKAVPLSLARWGIEAAGRWRFRGVDRGIPLEYRQELAGIAAGFSPDPFAHILPTYHRFVFLYSLYDIALFFEKSPLIGCTTFTASTPAGSYLARAFDFEVDEVFDREKVVFVVREPGKIAFASVGWPGFVGVVSGMNAEGVAVVVHGGRGGVPTTNGIPVVYSLREVLTNAHTLAEATDILAHQNVMVSHIVIAMDSTGAAAVIERAPGHAAFIRPLPARAVTTNHFEGELKDDPHNREVLAKTSTRNRRARGDALLEQLPAEITPATMATLLRDRRAPDGTPLALGDRKAIDALIATHAIIADTTHRILWVSEAPHVLGRFLKFDLKKLLGPEGADTTLETLPADPLLESGAYDVWRTTQGTSAH